MPLLEPALWKFVIGEMEVPVDEVVGIDEELAGMLELGA